MEEKTNERQSYTLPSGAATVLAAIVVSLMLVPSLFLSAQEIPTARVDGLHRASNLRDINTALQQRGSVVFRDTPLHEVLYSLGEQWKINIVAGADVTGLASGVFRDATLQEILNAILSVNGYGYRQNGESLVVLKQEQIGPNNPNFKAETLLLPESTSAETMGELVEALSVFSSPQGGKVQPIPSSNRIIVYDSPEQIAQMQQVLTTLLGSAPGVTNLPSEANASGLGSMQLAPVRQASNQLVQIRPQFVNVQDVMKAIELAVGSNGSFTSLDKEQVILVSGSPDVISRALDAARQVDMPRTQVRITSYIYDVSLNDLEKLGFDWSSQTMSQSLDANGVPRNNIRMDGGLLTRNPATAAVQPAAAATTTTTTAAAATTASAPTGGQWFFRTLSNNWELSTVLQALDSTKGAKLLADPHVTVIDRETATIDIVTKIPIQQLTQTQQGGAIGTTAFEEAGIKLNVTPRIANDGTVEMVVEPEFSTLSGFNNGNPIIDARRAKTTVRVANQHTLVLGGLRQKTAVETVSGIPGLKDIKFVGALFRAHNTEIRESELICFIQPEIIDYCAPGLPREEVALYQQKAQLSNIPVSCMGPHVPDCKDPHCPYHHPKPRLGHAFHDEGLVYPVGGPQQSAPPFPASFDNVPVYPAIPPEQTFEQIPQASVSPSDGLSATPARKYMMEPAEVEVQPVIAEPAPYFSE